ncbi:hypothetical protein ACFV5N_21195 [Streptomyces sp. NPDC059853]|uniref:DUF6197 family protein n=1 Tax=Streptomyces sp. NPDC059853 TaxID=3346973 RepID=UPI003650AF33
MQPTQEVAATLRLAVHVISERGRTVGVFERAVTGAVCMVGAIRVAAHGDACTDDEGSEAAIEAVSTRIDSPIVYRDPIERIAEWHDRPERTDDEVIAQLRRIADELDTGVARQVAA